MKILVTGASGYIGRQLAEKLAAAGHEVCCMVRDAKRAPQLNSEIKFVEADALHADTLPPALKVFPQELPLRARENKTYAYCR